MIWENYQDAYARATRELRELLDSETIPECVKNSLRKRDLLILRKKAVLEIAGYTAGIQTVDETIGNLTQIGIADALQFIAEIQTCINQPASTPLPQQEQSTLASEIQQTEHDLATVRTMSHDMTVAKQHPQEQVYQSVSQADILSPGAAAPAAAQPEVPRWETDNRS